jgi:hypothetical protein
MKTQRGSVSSLAFGLTHARARFLRRFRFALGRSGLGAVSAGSLALLLRRRPGSNSAGTVRVSRMIERITERALVRHERLLVTVTTHLPTAFGPIGLASLSPASSSALPSRGFASTARVYVQRETPAGTLPRAEATGQRAAASKLVGMHPAIGALPAPVTAWPGVVARGAGAPAPSAAARAAASADIRRAAALGSLPAPGTLIPRAREQGVRTRHERAALPHAGSVAGIPAVRASVVGARLHARTRQSALPAARVATPIVPSPAAVVVAERDVPRPASRAAGNSTRRPRAAADVRAAARRLPRAQPDTPSPAPFAHDTLPLTRPRSSSAERGRLEAHAAGAWPSELALASRSAAGASPAAGRSGRASSARALPLVRRPADRTDAAPDLSALRQELEQTLQQRLVERVESTVARELAPESASVRRLSEQLQASLHDGLLLEKERLGWG